MVAKKKKPTESGENYQKIPRLGLSEQLISQMEEPSDLDKVLAHFEDPDNFGQYTELSRNEILAFSILTPLGRKHDLEMLLEFLRSNKEHRISKGRGGRKEFIKIVGRQEIFQQPEEEPRGFRRYFRK